MLLIDLVQRMFSRAKGLPEAEAVDALRNACIEFCQKTYVLTTGAQVVVDGTEVPVVDLTVAVVDVVEAEVGGKNVLVTHLNDPRADDISAGDDPDYDYALRFAEPNNMELTPPATTDAPVTLDLLIVVAPGPDATEIDDFLWQRYHEPLLSGALYRVLAEPGRPWSNPEAAVFHKDRFDAAMEDAKAWAAKNRQTTARKLRVTPSL